MMSPLDVLDFWWRAGPDRWYANDPAFDADIRARFLALHARAAAHTLPEWERTCDGALALVIILDQFSRNMFRGKPEAFAQDKLAREIADRAIVRGFDRAFPIPYRGFFYLPFEHSEDMTHQDRCVDLYRAANDADGLKFALAHRDVIGRFGRFPARNAALGRDTTNEEQTFLKEGGGW